MQGGHFIPIPFAELTDPATGKSKVRLVDTSSTRYAIARRYMIRLRRDDFDNPDKLARLARSANLSPEEFRREFESVVANEPPPLAIDDHGEAGARLSGIANSNPKLQLPRIPTQPKAVRSARLVGLWQFGRWPWDLDLGAWPLTP